jgi:hypothetical protein
MLTRILHPTTRRELYAFSSAIPTNRHLTPTSWGLYGPDGVFKKMMATVRNDARLKEAGGFVICTQRLKPVIGGYVVETTQTKYDL